MEKEDIKKKLYVIVFETRTPAGRLFDVVLIACIVLSIVIIALDSVEELAVKYGTFFTTMEWILTGLFTLEYALRIYILDNKKKFILSFYGIVDLLSLLPTYLGLFLSGAHALLVIRSIRLMRVFRVLKLVQFVGEGRELARALKSSSYKISVFLVAVITVVMISGTFMFILEGKENGFTSIPQGIYWAVVTLTTVGYGDISPVTPMGKLFASVIMILGYAIIAIPTGIVSAEMVRGSKSQQAILKCESCSREDHDKDAVFCKHCGSKLVQKHS